MEKTSDLAQCTLRILPFNFSLRIFSVSESILYTVAETVPVDPSEGNI